MLRVERLWHVWLFVGALAVLAVAVYFGLWRRLRRAEEASKRR